MTATLVPPQTVDQRLAALERANRVRVARAQTKRQLSAGAVDATRLLARPPAHLLSMKVETFLCALPKFGPVKTTKVMRRLLISPAKTVGGLSDRQRAALIEELGA